MNWYLIIFLVILGLSHLHTLNQSEKQGGVYVLVFVALTVLFWWLVYMSGIFTLL